MALQQLPGGLDGSDAPYEVDPKYEFCAPQYMDFASLMGGHNEYDDDADDWFDTVATRGLCSPLTPRHRTPKASAPVLGASRSPVSHPASEQKTPANGSRRGTGRKPRNPVETTPALKRRPALKGQVINPGPKTGPTGRSNAQAQLKSSGASAVDASLGSKIPRLLTN